MSITFKCILRGRLFVITTTKHDANNCAFYVRNGNGGGGSFFIACEFFFVLFLSVCLFFENVRLFNPRLRFFFKVEISSLKLTSLFRQGSVHSGSAN